MRILTRRFVTATAMLGLIALVTTQAQAGSLVGGADPLFDFSFSGAGISGSGTLDAYSNGDGTFTAISGTGTVIGAPNGESVVTLYANPNAPNEVYSPSGFFIYDNQLLPGQDPLITNGGLLFMSNGYEVNIYGNGPDSYTYYDNSGYNTPVSFSLSQAAVPEPPTMILAGVAGLMGLGCARRRRRKAVAV